MLDKQLQDPEEDQDEENSGSSRNGGSSSSTVSRIASPDYNDDALDLNNVEQFDAERTTHIEQTTPIMSSHMDIIDEVKEEKLYDEEEPLTIPQSTHSFLFTEDINSMPFLFSVGIAGICCTCLLLALINNLQNGQVPANVDVSVKIAQYMSILVSSTIEIVCNNVNRCKILDLCVSSHIHLMSLCTLQTDCIADGRRNTHRTIPTTTHL